MTKLNIITYPNPHLRLKSEPINDFGPSLQRLIDDMIETLYTAENGIGLAAPQVDIQKQLCVIDVEIPSKHQPLIFINPVILEKKGEQETEEGCLSVPGASGKAKRAITIKVKAQDREGKDFELEADGLLAICIQHEMDHLAGKLFIDYSSPLKQMMILKKAKKLVRIKEVA